MSENTNPGIPAQGPADALSLWDKAPPSIKGLVLVAVFGGGGTAISTLLPWVTRTEHVADVSRLESVDHALQGQIDALRAGLVRDIVDALDAREEARRRRR